jgi:hypothetical protein
MRHGAMMISGRRFASQLGSNFRGRIINEYGGTLEDPCPTTFVGGLNWCGSGDYKGWIRAAEKQKIEIERKEDAVSQLGLPLSYAAENYRAKYRNLYNNLDPVGWDAWNTREKVMRTISIMEVGAAYEDTLAQVIKDGGLEVEEAKPPLFKFKFPWGWVLTLGGIGLVGYALTKSPQAMLAKKLTRGLTK